MGTDSEEFKTWASLEFEQSYVQLRDRDQLILSVVKYYITFIAAIGTVSVSILGLKAFGDKNLLIGALMCGGGILGSILLAWLVALRKYFVSAAQQLNALRGYFVKSLTEDQKREIVVQGTDATYPPTWNASSSHIVVCLLVMIVNAAFVGGGTCLLTRAFFVEWSACRYVVTSLIIAVVFGGFNFGFCRYKLR